jgi:prepilin-type N-terminal cleavage/methylation domain-containing protein
MKGPRYGFTILEMIAGLVIIASLCVIYVLLTESYTERRMSEQAAKALMLTAKTQEDFFAKEHRYFDVEVSGNGTDTYLITPDGAKTNVFIPSKVHLTIKTRQKDKPGFVGFAYSSGSPLIHKYDSESGKIVTLQRGRDETG